MALTWLCLPAFSSAQSMHEAWVQRHDGAYHGTDIPSGVVADNSGNVIVTGQVAVGVGTTDAYTAKYAADGTLIWEATYSGPGNGNDIAAALVLDSVGNVIITGSSANATGIPDIFTVKYAAQTGAVLWQQRYAGAANDYDAGKGVAVDAQDNVFVIGTSTESLAFQGGGGYDYCTLKYAASNGQQLWVRTYNGPGNGNDYPYALAVDAAGNVIVTGGIIGLAGNEDIYTIKYSAANGTTLWAQTFDGSAHSTDAAIAIALDGTGHVFVAGSSSNGSNFDYITLQYDAATGSPGWTKREDGPGHGYDTATAIAVDPTGNVIITGSAPGIGTGNDILTIKYAPDGTRLWGATYNDAGNGDDQGRGLSVDGAGNIFVSGMAKNGTYYDFVTLKYASDGSNLWTQLYDGPDHNNDMGLGRNALTPDGGVVVTGESFGALNYDFTTVKYAPDAASAPQVTTGQADLIVAAGGVLHAVVNASLADASVVFDYGLSTSYGSSLAGDPATVSGAADTDVTATLTGLTPQTLYHVRARAVNSVGETQGDDQTFTTAGTPVEVWKFAHFGAAWASVDMADDPDNDGISNFLEYALGGDPTVSDPQILPQASMQDGHLCLSFTRNANLTDLTYTVSASNDLMVWSPIARSSNGGPMRAFGEVNMPTIVEVGRAAVKSVLVTDAVTADALHPLRFLRLEMIPAGAVVGPGGGISLP